MKITKIVDKYNENKIWIVKKYSHSEIYLNQEINGKLFYNKYQKSSKKNLKNIGIL
jgi:hypothetical protein